MNLELNEEQKQIKTLVRDFCQREVDPKRMNEILRKNDVAAMTLDSAKAIEEIIWANLSQLQRTHQSLSSCAEGFGRR